MTQNYTSLSTILLSLFTVLFINDMEILRVKKPKLVRINFVVDFSLLRSLTSDWHFFTNILKKQSFFANHYLAFASSRGIGGGGGHGNTS